MFSKNQRHVAVRTVKILLLLKFPKILLKELEDLSPLDGFGMNSKEAQHLNIINQDQCVLYHGLLEGDLIVKLDEFTLFHRIVQKHFMNMNVEVKSKKYSNNATLTPSN